MVEFIFVQLFFCFEFVIFDFVLGEMYMIVFLEVFGIVCYFFEVFIVYCFDELGFDVLDFCIYDFQFDFDLIVWCVDYVFLFCGDDFFKIKIVNVVVCIVVVLLDYFYLYYDLISCIYLVWMLVVGIVLDDFVGYEEVFLFGCYVYDILMGSEVVIECSGWFGFFICFVCEYIVYFGENDLCVGVLGGEVLFNYIFLLENEK